MGDLDKPTIWGVLAYSDAQYKRATWRNYPTFPNIFFRIKSVEDLKIHPVENLVVVLPDFSFYPHFYKCVIHISKRDKISARSVKRNVHKIMEGKSVYDIVKEKQLEDNLKVFSEIGS